MMINERNPTTVRMENEMIAVVSFAIDSVDDQIKKLTEERIALERN